MRPRKSPSRSDLGLLAAMAIGLASASTVLAGPRAPAPAVDPAPSPADAIHREVFAGLRAKLEGEWEAAARHFRAALAGHERLDAPDPTTGVTILSGLFHSELRRESYQEAAEVGQRLRLFPDYRRGTASPRSLDHVARLIRAHREIGDHETARRLHAEAVGLALDPEAPLELDHREEILAFARESHVEAGEWDRASSVTRRHLERVRRTAGPHSLEAANLLRVWAQVVLAPAGRRLQALARARESEEILRARVADGDFRSQVALVTVEELLLRLYQQLGRHREARALVEHIRQAGGDGIGLVVVTTDPPGARVFDLVGLKDRQVRGTYRGSTRAPLLFTHTSFLPARLWIEFPGRDEPVHREVAVRPLTEVEENRVHADLSELDDPGGRGTGSR